MITLTVNCLKIPILSFIADMESGAPPSESNEGGGTYCQYIDEDIHCLSRAPPSLGVGRLKKNWG